MAKFGQNFQPYPSPSLSKSDYTVKPFPWYRKMVHDATRLGLRKPYIQFVTEANVDKALHEIQSKNSNSSVRVSLNHALVQWIAESALKFPEILSYRSGNQKVFQYTCVDLMTPIDFELEDGHMLFPVVFRNVDEMTCSEIAGSIREKAMGPTPRLVPQERFFLRLPWVIRKHVYTWLYKSPERFRSQLGTLFFSPSHMLGKGNPNRTTLYPISAQSNIEFANGGFREGNRNQIALIPYHTTGVYTGSLFEANGKTTLSLTVLCDHDLIDGTVMKNFMADLVNRIERGKFN